ncbi:alpha-L-fucosidase [Bacteroides sp. BFG-551]|nr:alpha-L-fucosidase [Bacteroides sp. BFG-551]
MESCRFKPSEWVKAAKEAGFKYIVLTTKHHDGYTMWPSRYGDFGVKQKLGGRDLVREFVDACRENGLKIGLYFSPPDWHYDAEYMNWDYSKKTVLDVRHHPLTQLPKKPEGHDEKRKEMAANQVRELLTDYGKIDIMWFDGGHGEISNDEVRRLQPGIVINRRNKEPGDFGDSEGVLPDKRFEGWFETNDPCWPSRWWGYSQSDRMDTGGDVIEKLVILRAWGGNFLANVGPKADGSMPEEALEAWKEIGKWMKHSGESVFDVTGGTFPEQCNQPMTLKGDSVMYLHTFPNFHKEILVKGQKRKPLRAILLRTGDEIPFLYENQVLKIQIPARQRSRSVDTVKLIF